MSGPVIDPIDSEDTDLGWAEAGCAFISACHRAERPDPSGLPDTLCAVLSSLKRLVAGAGSSEVQREVFIRLGIVFESTLARIHKILTEDAANE
jgi:hypothetical protein